MQVPRHLQDRGQDLLVQADLEVNRSILSRVPPLHCFLPRGNITLKIPTSEQLRRGDHNVCVYAGVSAVESLSVLSGCLSSNRALS